MIRILINHGFKAIKLSHCKVANPWGNQEDFPLQKVLAKPKANTTFPELLKMRKIVLPAKVSEDLPVSRDGSFFRKDLPAKTV